MLGQTFTKTWRVSNQGREPWKGGSLQCLTSDTPVHMQSWCFSHPLREIQIPDLQPLESTEISVEFTAPSEPCTVMSEWKLKDANGLMNDKGQGTLRCIVRVID